MGKLGEWKPGLYKAGTELPGALSGGHEDPRAHEHGWKAFAVHWYWQAGDIVTWLPWP